MKTTAAFETVAAISTPPGKGGVAVIRMSGADAVRIAERCFRARSGRGVSSLPDRTAVYGDILANGEPIDDGILTLFRAPRSYTGEDTVEISCHGGLLVQARVLEGLLRAGAKPAPPGEFTRRAYLSGSISLSDAEAIGALIDAENDEQLRLSSRRARSRFSERTTAIADALLAVMSELDALLDYPEEEPSETTAEGFAARLSEIADEITELCGSYQTGRAVSSGIRGVLAGKPNVGKSSVYNRLLGEDAAIVTQVAGTTRDVLERKVLIGRVTVELADTAGVHETDDPVEAIGVRRSRERIGAAELILAVLDRSQPLDGEDLELLDYVKKAGGTPILLLNKSDLTSVWGREQLPTGFENAVECSTLTGEGFDRLAMLVNELFTDLSLTLGESAIVTTARQLAALRDAEDALRTASRELAGGYPLDAAAATVEAALRALFEVDGRAAGEEIVDAIFRNFCVGK